MSTFLVLAAIIVLWYLASYAYMRSGRPKARRQKTSFAWGFVGAVVGSFVGIAGFGGAIVGTIPGAIIGYLIASNLMKKDSDA